MYFGAKYSNNGIDLQKGFAGFILEITLYSNSALSIAYLDTQIDWDCTVSTMKLCDFCPANIGIPQMCLEDLTGSGRVSDYLKA
jgi:hypothetical protein